MGHPLIRRALAKLSGRQVVILAGLALLAGVVVIAEVWP